MTHLAFLGWADASPRTTPHAKIVAAVEAYTARFGRAPAEVRCHPESAATVEGVTVVSVESVGRGVYLVGPVPAGEG